MIRRIGRPLIALALVALPWVLLRVPAVQAVVLSLVGTMRGGGARGIALYLVAYTVGALVAAPTLMLTGLAGFAWGPLRGMLIASPVNLIASTIGFALGRRLLRGRVAAWLGRRPGWAVVDDLATREGLKIAVLLRLSPVVPQSLLPYAFSTTKLRLRDFALGTWLGLLPLSLVYAWAGSLVDDAVALVEGRGPTVAGPARIAITVGGFVMTLVVVWWTTRMARASLARLQAGTATESASS